MSQAPAGGDASTLVSPVSLPGLEPVSLINIQSSEAGLVVVSGYNTLGNHVLLEPSIGPIDSIDQSVLCAQRVILEDENVGCSIPGVFNELENPEENARMSELSHYKSNFDFIGGHASCIDPKTNVIQAAQLAEDEDEAEEEEVESILTNLSTSASSDSTNSDHTPVAVDPNDQSELPVSLSIQRSPDPRHGDEVVLRTIIRTMGEEAAEWEITYLDHTGILYTVNKPLPTNHFMSPEMIHEHSLQRSIAIRERAEELQCTVEDVRLWIAREELTRGIRNRNGYIDGDPPLFTVTAHHDWVARLGPEDDDDTAFPGFRVRNLLPGPGEVSHPVLN
ncbi:hypothetical protein R3P38DRAFT_2797861 [Favolaschia claudopus]|uniref:Uncharacterized protein n=1 Tax=Favolaschia claudopus TaxID=2862362 RepID=A0AAW0A3F8_9AGAR